MPQAAELNAGLLRDLEKHKKAKAEWDQLSRSALDEMFELRKRCSMYEERERQQSEIMSQLLATQKQQAALVASFGAPKV